MVTNLMMRDKVDIPMDSRGRFQIGDDIIRTKDVPIVRYDTGGDTDTAYIKKMQKLFNKSVHLLQIELSQVTIELVQRAIDNNMPIIIMVHITNETNEKELIGLIREKFAELDELDGDGRGFIEKLQFVDRTDNLTFEKYRIIEEAAKKITKCDVGICTSALSIDSRQCISAVRARELQAIYTDAKDAPLVTQKYEGTELCKCVHHVVLDADTKIVVPKAKKSTDSRNEKIEDGKADGKSSSKAKSSKQPKERKKIKVPSLEL